MAQQKRINRPPKRSLSSSYDQPGHVVSDPGISPVTNEALNAAEEAGSSIDNIDQALADNSDFRESLEGAQQESISPEKLANAEQSPDNPKESEADTAERSLYKGSPDKKKRRGLLNGMSPRAKIIGGGTAGLLVTLIIAGFTFFSPILRLESYLSKINQRAFTFAASAVEARAGHLLERYMVLHMLNLERCTANRSIDCRADYGNQGIAGGLFNSWRDVRIEQKLFDRYGISVESSRTPNSQGGLYRFKDRRGNNITPTREGFRNAVFTGGGREAGRELRLFLKDETRWYQVMERKSIRKYLTRKHGINLWCFLACKTRDNVDIKLADAKTRFKYRFVERFVHPFSAKYGVIMDCLIQPNNSRCSAQELSKRGIDRQSLPEVKEIIDDIKSNPNTRLSQIVIENLLKKVGLGASAKGITSAIPVAGQIYFGLTLVDMADRIDSCIEEYCLSKYGADLKSRQYVEYYTAMRSANDEMKKGLMSFEDAGELVSQFDGAEQSRLYHAYNPPSTRGTASLFSNAAYAETLEGQKEDEQYTCNDDKPIPPGELVCPEKRLDYTFTVEEWRNNPIVDGLSTALNVYSPFDCVGDPCFVVRNTLSGIDYVFETITGPLLSGALAAARATPGISGVISFIEEKTGELTVAFFTKVFPLPVEVDSPGRERYDALEAGGDIVANEFARGGYTDSGEPYGLGGRTLSDAEMASIVNDRYEQLAYEHQNSSFYDRILDIDNPRSLASGLIMNSPRDLHDIPKKFTTNVASIFSRLLTGDMFSPNTAWADHTPGHQVASPFIKDRHGYSLNDPALTMDPSLITEEYCANATATWESSRTEDPITGIESFSSTNPCLLELAAVEAAGGLFMDDNSEPDLPSAPDGALTGGGNPASPGSLPSGGAQEIAQQLLASSSVTWRNQTAKRQVEAIAEGGQGEIDTELLRVLLALSQRHSFAISSMKRCTPRLGAGSNSRHCVGKAVDISGASGIDGVPFGYGDTSPDPAIKKFIDYAIELLPGGCEVGLPNITYVRNHRPKVKAGCSIFIDKGTASHIHLGVPR